MKEASEGRSEKLSKMHPQLESSLSLMSWRRFKSSPYLNSGLGGPMAFIYPNGIQVKKQIDK